MTTEKSVVAEAENPPQQQKPEEEKHEEVTEAGICEAQPEEDCQKEGEPKLRKKQKVTSSVSTNGDTPTHGDQNKSKDRHSEGRGLSRLFSSFLKRPKSQVLDEDKEAQSTKEKVDAAEKAEHPEEEILLKAPIAAPEPELRTDPSLDLHSLSSAETQPAQEDRGDNQDFDQDFEAKEEEGEEPEQSAKGDNTDANPAKELKTSQKSIKKSRAMRCKVTLLDDTVFECEVEKHAKGQDLIKKVCDHLNLMEEDYFGLAIWESESSRVWLDAAKEIKKQIHGPWNFTFNVKFYPPDPAQLTEDITRYNLCLQLRQDIMSGRLPCSFATLALLGSYTVQSELGDYDPDLHGTDYISEIKLSPNQTKELEEKVIELHRSYRSMTPAQADLEFLENAKKLSMYGVDLHQAKDMEGVDITLGVCSSGLLVYKDKLRINRFPWPKVLKISYKRSSFFIKIRPGEQEQYESTIGFKLPSYKAAKRLWKVCVEHHTFFRLTSTEAIPKGRFLALGSKFRYSGRTQAQTRHASALIDRPAPQFERTASKRASRSLDGAAVVVTPDRRLRPISAPAIAQRHGVDPSRSTSADVNEISASRGVKEAVEVEVKQEEKPSERASPEFSEVEVGKEHREVPVPTTNGDKVQNPAEREDDLIRMRKDLDKTQEEIMKHHASISELKKSFMESVPAARPSEWDKRLSTHSPFRALNINGQVHTGVDGSMSVLPNQDVDDVTEMKNINPEYESPTQANSLSQITTLLGSLTHQDCEPSLTSCEGKEEAPGSKSHAEPRHHQGLDMSADKVVDTTEQSGFTPPVIFAEPQLYPCEEKEVEFAEDGEETYYTTREQLIKRNGRTSNSSIDRPSVLIRCFQPPLVKTQTVTISDVSNVVKSDIPTKEVPLVHTETKTITYEAAQTDDGNADLDPGILLTAHTITSETTSSTTTTQITKTVKGGISETRIEKRIVITGDSDIDHDQVLVQAIKEAKEQHPDMSVTKVVVHQETEISEE